MLLLRDRWRWLLPIYEWRSNIQSEYFHDSRIARLIFEITEKNLTR
jgi:hypothetical protein